MTQTVSEIIGITLHDNNGDTAVLTFNDAGQPTLCRTAWDIAPFLAQLRRDYPTPKGCEWMITSLVSAQVVSHD